MALEEIRDRRFNARIPVCFPIELDDISYTYTGTVVDLSPGGARVEASPAPPLGTELDLELKPDGLGPLKLKGRVVHEGGSGVGIAFNLGKPEAFEAALNLYETILISNPALAIGIKRRPTRIAYTARLYPLPLRGVTLSGPEHWVMSQMKPEGTLLWDLRRALGPEWARLAHVPFALIERGVASLQPPRHDEIEPDPLAQPVGRLRR